MLTEGDICRRNVKEYDLYFPNTHRGYLAPLNASLECDAFVQFKQKQKLQIYPKISLYTLFMLCLFMLVVSFLILCIFALCLG